MCSMRYHLHVYRLHSGWYVAFPISLVQVLSPVYPAVTLNFVTTMKAFVYTSGRQNVVDVLNVTRNWVGLTRYTLYIVQVLIADSVLVRKPLLCSVDVLD